MIKLKTGASWNEDAKITFKSKDGWPTVDSFYDDPITKEEFEIRKGKSTVITINKNKRGW